MSEIVSLSLKELIEKLEKNEITEKQIKNELIEWTRKYDLTIKAYISFDYDGKNPGKFPVAVKDNIATTDFKTTCGSKILENFKSPYDAEAVSRLKKSYFYITGKTNLDEFAMGSSTENSAFFPTKNPWNPLRSPGGSSGGSASAVASFMVPVALGSDTGGSVRQPGAFCGVYALKPTYGRISRYGLVAFASSLDQIGIFARIPWDIAYVLEIVSGKDLKDSTSSEKPVERYTKEMEKPLGQLKVAYLSPEDSHIVEKEVKEKYHSFIEFFKLRGDIVEEVEFPEWEYGLYAYYIIASSEASSNLSRYDGIRYGLRERESNLDALYKNTRTIGFGDEVKRRILMGTFSLSSGYYDEYYLKATKVRYLIAKRFDKIFKDYDIILSPTTGETAFLLGEKLMDPIRMYSSDYFTIPPSLGGYPAINVPFSINSEGLPIGMQIIANYFKESLLLKVGNEIENNIKFERTLKRRFL